MRPRNGIAEHRGMGRRNNYVEEYQAVVRGLEATEFPAAKLHLRPGLDCALLWHGLCFVRGLQARRRLQRTGQIPFDVVRNAARPQLGMDSDLLPLSSAEMGKQHLLTQSVWLQMFLFRAPLRSLDWPPVLLPQVSRSTTSTRPPGCSFCLTWHGWHSPLTWTTPSIAWTRRPSKMWHQRTRRNRSGLWPRGDLEDRHGIFFLVYMLLIKWERILFL